MKETLYDRRLLDVIALIFANRESGRLKIQAGATVGFFSFKEGKLADAHMGALTGFPAINAALSIREAHFSFDPSSPPLASNFNTPNERIVLKQLFGIETADPEAADNQVSANVSEIPTLSREVPLSNATDPEWIATDPIIGAYNQAPDDKSIRATGELAGTLEAQPIEDDESREPEVTLVTAKVPKRRRTISYPPLSSLPKSYSRGLYVAVLLISIGAGAATVTFLSELNDRRSPTSATEPSVSATEPSVSATQPSASATEPSVSAADPSVSATEPNASAAKPSESSLPLIAHAGKQIEISSEPQNLTGRWKVVNVVEKTSYRSFSNLKIAFLLHIKQTGPNFTAEGEKLSENGRVLPATNRTPIRVTGSVDGERVEATFIEEGMRRKTSGRFVWRIEKAGAGLTGTFDSTAARTSGKSAATKEL